MKAKAARPPTLTPVDFVVLGLVAERPRHGYDVETAIEQRRLRSWTPIGFSSIYHVLNKLADSGMLASETRPGERRPQRVYRTTRNGRKALLAHLRRVISVPARTGHEIELAMMFASFLEPAELVNCLAERADRAAADLDAEKRLQRQYRRLRPLVWRDLIFRHTTAYLSAELAWTRQALAALGGAGTAPGRK